MSEPPSQQTNPRSGKRRRRGGLRAGRRGGEKGTSTALPSSRPSSRLIPAYELLDDTALTQLEEQADWLLEKIGMEFRGDEVALELFRDAGARVDGECVKFEAGLARQLCKTAPAEFTLHSRNTEPVSYTHLTLPTIYSV